jgi:hypothetical protein
MSFVQAVAKVLDVGRNYSLDYYVARMLQEGSPFLALDLRVDTFPKYHPGRTGATVAR